jgi:hypothetical protein
MESRAALPDPLPSLVGKIEFSLQMEFVICFAVCAATLGGRWRCGDAVIAVIKMFGRLAAGDGGVMSLVGADCGGGGGGGNVKRFWIWESCEVVRIWCGDWQFADDDVAADIETVEIEGVSGNKQGT